MQKILYILVFFLTTPLLLAQTTVTLDADGPGDTYELLSNVLGGTSYEVPDCGHSDFGRHISEVWDDELQAYVFAFDIHVTPDNDRCTNFDRQRNEIKTYDQSPDHLLAAEGETHIYRWKFKVDSLFQASPNFSHMFQIKPRGGPDDSMPALTITLRYGFPDQLQVRHAPSNSNASNIATLDLPPLRGQWLDVYCRVLNLDEGKLEFSIKTLDGTTLLSVSDYQIDMWRQHANFNRPKWGIYRSLDNPSYLRDEQVHFANFSITEPPASPAPNAPVNLGATTVSLSTIELNWADSSANETNFLIQRSPDGTTWANVAVVDSNITTYSDFFLPANTTFYYRVRAENWETPSAFSNVDSATTGLINDIVDTGPTIPETVALAQNYPNPFNPATHLRFGISDFGFVDLRIYDMSGRLVKTLVQENLQAGSYTAQWDATDDNGKKVSSGIYYAQLKSAGIVKTRKMAYMR